MFLSVYFVVVAATLCKWCMIFAFLYLYDNEMKFAEYNLEVDYFMIKNDAAH